MKSSRRFLALALLAAAGAAGLYFARPEPEPPAPASPPVRPAERAPVRFDLPADWGRVVGDSLIPSERVARETPGTTVLRLPGSPLAELQIEAKARGDFDPLPALRESLAGERRSLLHDRETTVAGRPAQDFAFFEEGPLGAQAFRVVSARVEDRSYTWFLRVGELDSTADAVRERFERASADLEAMLASAQLDR